MSNDDPRTAYTQVADDLRRQIAAGVLKPGQRLDSNAKLAERYGVAPMTIRHSLDILRTEGLVVSQHGRGTFIATNPPTDTTLPDTVFAELTEIKTAITNLNARVDRLETQVRGELQ